MTIFYKNELSEGVNQLSTEESRHCALVLRHQIGDHIMIFDGVGGKHTAVLIQVSKNKCEFEITKTEKADQKSFRTHLAIAPTKNMDRMEWLMEKLSEIGVDEVTFLQSKHSERKKLRLDRLEKKAISAMKQSGNPFLMKLNDLVSYDRFIQACNSEAKFIAHVDDSHTYLSELIQPNTSTTLLIGPEGDFSKDEVDLAIQSGFQSVSLGQNTLRTETAGFVACCIINVCNSY